MRYRYDPELAAALAMMAEVDITDLATARAAQAGEVAARVAAADTSGVRVTELSAPGPPGAPDVPLRVHRPEGAVGGEPLPVLYALHGGGFVLGSPTSTTRPTCGWSANSASSWSPRTTGSRRSTRIPPPWRTATPGCAHWPATPPSWASRRSGSRCAATAPGPLSPPR
ncbi:hypothetical protein GCM10018793_29530 [Streptomyces sulfonofaciens]|uniref:Alpha/beta hydrolase fold-3 domain-containing protein n=1 Tax=Streptomyces sulfonofaciens TaxID=68272 RepID=A0A919KZR7_9ACTN|nr:hypothetical protein GCM10018793_29530 [Streptomyces sulfonofaciens]